MKVLAVVPANPDWPLVWPQTWDSLLALRWTGQLDYLLIRGEPPGEARDRVLRKYQFARKQFLAGDYDTLFTVEADMIVPRDALMKLAELEAPVAYGLYCWRHWRPYWNAYLHVTNVEGWSISEYPSLAVRHWGHPVDVAGLGSGCTLLRRDVVERLEFWRPGNACQDWGTSLDCQRLGIRQVAHLGVVCGHIAPEYPAKVIWPDNVWPMFRFEYLDDYRSEAMHRYIGDGKWIPGVPKRDLTDEEWDALWPAEKQAIAHLFETDPHPSPLPGGEGAGEPDPLPRGKGKDPHPHPLPLGEGEDLEVMEVDDGSQ